MAKIISDEIEVQNSICEYLATKKLFFWRNNNIPVFDSKRNSYRKMPKYSKKGVADIIVLVNGFAYFLEVKDKGYQSKDQKEFEKGVKEAGCQYYVVRSIDDVAKIFS
jgi:hypothetical protein